MTSHAVRLLVLVMALVELLVVLVYRAILLREVLGVRFDDLAIALVARCDLDWLDVLLQHPVLERGLALSVLVHLGNVRLLRGALDLVVLLYVLSHGLWLRVVQRQAAFPSSCSFRSD